LAESLKDLALGYIREKYRDFGPLLAHEKLTEIHKLKISLMVVRKLMIQDGLWNPERKQKRVFISVNADAFSRYTSTFRNCTYVMR